MNNREIITDAVVAYMQGLPIPKELPKNIRMEIYFEQSAEKHIITFGEGEEQKPRPKSQASVLIDMYNEICGEKLPRVRITTEKRKKALSVRLRERDIADFEELFKKASASDFLCGKNDRGWNATFDWLINETNMAKVLEGNFDNKHNEVRTRAGTATARTFDPDEAFKKALERGYGGNV